MPRPPVLRCASLIAGLACLVAPLAAQNGTDTPTQRRVPRVSTRVHVDAVLDEPVWEQALVIALDYEVRPGENIPPPVRTEVLLAYGDSHLYAAFRAFDPDPAAIRATVTDRDDMYGDDWVALILDTFNDERRTFDFFSNPLGIQGDQVESPDGGGEWDAIWDSHGRITDGGYVVEMAIPFSSMRFQRTEGDQVWGFDAVRSYPRDVRHHIGAFPRDRNNNCYMCQSIKLIGFAGATPGRNVELAPTVYGVVTQERDGFPSGPMRERDRDFEPGITGRWGLTPSLTLNATVNPDFSNVEADVAQLDINTRFALYYPERRPFFMEGSSFFNTRLRAVHTRTLADPIWGTKLTGKEADNALGFFTVQDQFTNLLFPASQGSDRATLEQKAVGSVLRYRRDLGRASNLGLLVTDREGDGYHNRVAGLDGIWSFTQKDQIRFQGLGSSTRYPDSVAGQFGQPDGRFLDYGFDVFYLHDTKTWDWYAVYRQLGQNFRADLGFMPQTDMRVLDTGWGHTWNEGPDHWWNMLNLGSGYFHMWDMQGLSLERGFSIWADYAGKAQSFLDVYASWGKQLYDGVEFDSRSVNFYAGMRPAGALLLSLEGTVGDQIDYANTRPGTRIRLEPYTEMKLGRHITVGLSHAYEHLNVDQGRLYTANVSQLRTTFCFNKRLFFRTILQHVYYDRNAALYEDEVDELSRSLFSQLLLSYKLNPQTVVYLGYSDNHEGDQDVGLTQANRTFFMKFGYAWVW